MSNWGYNFKIIYHGSEESSLGTYIYIYILKCQFLIHKRHFCSDQAHNGHISSLCQSDLLQWKHKRFKKIQQHSSRKIDLTPTSWLSLIPLWVLRVHALNHHRALLQRVAWVTGEFHYRPDAVGGVSAAEVPILHKGFVTRAPGKSFGQNMQKGFILGSLCCSC